MITSTVEYAKEFFAANDGLWGSNTTNESVNSLVECVLPDRASVQNGSMNLSALSFHIR